MADRFPTPSRRRFLQGAALGTFTLGAAGAFAPGAFAEELTRTPRQTEGPFYPDRLPLDTDNDLIIVNDNLTPAVGEITHLTGRVLDRSGSPLKNCTVEIWQVDGNGIYIHSRAPGKESSDSNFQGYGRFLTASDGAYYFRTIKPLPYSIGAQRAPHIHVIVKQGEKRLLTSQFYVKGHPANDRDGIYNGIRDPKAKELVTLDFKPVVDSTTGELLARADIVVGHTAEEREAGRGPRPGRPGRFFGPPPGSPPRE